MTKIYCSLAGTTPQAAAFFADNWLHSDSIQGITGALIADLKDDTGANTGVSFNADVALASALASGPAAEAGVGEFPETVLERITLTANGGTSTVRLAGLPSGATYTLQLMGHNGNGAGVRSTQYTVEGTAQDYIVGTVAAPTAPTVFTGTVDPDGEIVISITKAASGQFYGYLNGFILEYTAAAAGLTIDSTDASMQRNTDFQVVCSTPDTTPTTGNTTLTNGNDTLTPSSVTGSDPYTLTFPVGDLSKQVDGTGYDWTLEITP